MVRRGRLAQRPNDVTAAHATVTGTPAADLTTLKADGTLGDGAYGGPAFTTGQYILLDDGNQAYYDGAAWQAGAMP